MKTEIAEGHAKRESIPWLLCASIAVAALALRLWQIDSTSFWLDEVLQVRVASEGFARIWELAPADKSPLDYYLAALFLKLGNSEFWARLPAAVYGGLWAGACAAAAFLVAGRPSALAAGVLAAIVPVGRRFGQEARPYSLMLLAQTLLLAAFFVLLDKRRASERNAALLLGGAIALALWSGFLNWLGTLTAGLGSGFSWFLFRNCPETRRLGRGGMLWVGGAMLAAIILGLPVLLRFLLSEPDGGYFMPWNVEDPMQRALSFLDIFAMGYDWYQYRPGSAWWLLVPGLAGTGLALWRNPQAGLVLIAALLQLPIVFVFMYRIDHWMEMRYVSMALPALLILAGAGYGETARRVMRGRTSRQAWVLAGTGILLIPYAWSALSYRVKEPMARPDWRSSMAFVERHREPGHLVAGGDWLDLVCAEWYARQRGWEEMPLLWEGVRHRASSGDTVVWVLQRHQGTDIGPPQVARFPLLTVRASVPPDWVSVLARDADEPFPALQAGGRIIPRDERPSIFVDGWLETEEWPGGFVYPIHKNGGRLAFSLNDKADLAVRVQASAFRPEIVPELSLELVVNGYSLGTQPASGAKASLGWKVPSHTTRSGLNLLELKPNRAIAPVSLGEGSGDKRALSFWVELLDIEYVR